MVKTFYVKQTYPSPVSGSVVAALPASPSDAMFQINENKTYREIRREQQLPVLPLWFSSAATPQVHSWTAFTQDTYDVTWTLA